MGGHTGYSPEEAYEAWQHDSLRIISAAMNELGIQIHPNSLRATPAYTRRGTNQWGYDRIRDRIEFSDLSVRKEKRVEDKAVVLKRDQYYASADKLDNSESPTPTDLSVEISQKQETRQLSQSQESHGWSISLTIEGTYGSSEFQQVKVSATTEAHGDYSSLKEKEETSGIEKKVTVSKTVGGREIYDIQQLHEKVVLKAPVTQELILDPAFIIVGPRYYRDMPHLLHDCRRRRRWGHTRESYVMFDCHNLNDLREILIGRSNDYPNIKHNLLEDRHFPKTQTMWDYFNDEEASYLFAKDSITFENATAGSYKIVELNSGRLIEDNTQEGASDSGSSE